MKNCFIFLGLLFSLLNVSSSVFAFKVSTQVISGEGKVEIFTVNGRRVLSETELSSGDKIIVFVSPKEQYGIEYMLVGDNIYYESPIQLDVTQDLNIEVGFKLQNVLFKETFGYSDIKAVKTTLYKNYDTSEDVAVITTNSGNESNSSIHNTALFNDDPSDDNDPDITHLYLQASDVKIQFAEGHKIKNSGDLQIKFRHMPVTQTDKDGNIIASKYNYTTALGVKINNIQQPSIFKQNVEGEAFYNDLDNPDSPENTNINNITQAPFVVLPIPTEYQEISSIIIQNVQQKVPYLNRCRIDDILIVGGDRTSISNISSNKVISVLSGNMLNFIGELKLKGNIVIYDINGEMLKSFKVTDSKSYSINCGDLPNLIIAVVPCADGSLCKFKLSLL